MTIESLYPYNDVYRLVDEDGDVLHQGSKIDCLIMKGILNNLENNG